jgi:hypothetical protein
MRRELVGTLESCDVAAVLGRLPEIRGLHPGWTVTTPAPPAGRVVPGASWILLLVREVIAESKTDAGAISAGMIDAGKAAISGRHNHPSPDGTGWLEIRMRWSRDQAFAIDEIRSAYANLALLAAREVITLAGGWIESRTGAPRQQEVSIGVPVSAAAKIGG